MSSKPSRDRSFWGASDAGEPGNLREGLRKEALGGYDRAWCAREAWFCSARMRSASVPFAAWGVMLGTASAVTGLLAFAAFGTAPFDALPCA